MTDHADLIRRLNDDATNPEFRDFLPAVADVYQKAATALASLAAELTRLRAGCVKDDADIQQTLGKVLGYPWFKDDQKNFPGATEADGVCVGPHVAASLAAEAAARITALAAENAALRKERDDALAKLAAGEQIRDALAKMPVTGNLSAADPATVALAKVFERVKLILQEDGEFQMDDFVAICMDTGLMDDNSNFTPLGEAALKLAEEP